MSPDRIKPNILEDRTARDSAHIMKMMKERNITDDMVRGYVDNSSVMFLQRRGRRMYVSDKGVTVVIPADDGWIAKTTWSYLDYDENMEALIRMINKYVR